MKSLLALLLTCVAAAQAFAQGVIYDFTVNLDGLQVVPASSSTYSGNGTLRLDGNSLNYFIVFQFPAPNFITSHFRGPAQPGANGPLVYDLETPSVVGPYPGDPGSLIYSGTLPVTSPQASDLRSGLWYMEVYTAQFPAGDVRGQITLVPEPSTLSLIGLGGVALVLVSRLRPMRR